MCGIVGVVGLSNSIDFIKSIDFKNMFDSIIHRGPDDSGVASGNNWVVGHRRLSIIDLSEQARQPFVNENGTCYLVANGEIYNYKELREYLVQSGHEFSSLSDCEVILHLLENDGIAGLQKLNGMFSFAYFDEESGNVLICRDRLGIKPLYYCINNGVFVFSSEIKALISDYCVSAVSCSDSINEFFEYRYVYGVNTCFKDVYEVTPGTFINVSLRNGDISDGVYWSPPSRSSAHSSVAVSDIRDKLIDSVRLQMVSDVPLGCQLSGGLDSSLITALAMRNANGPIHTFSIGFPDSPFDESQWALQVAQVLGTQHHAIPYSVHEFVEDFAYCTYLHDEPLNHPNSLPMYKLCREARKEVKVLLTGEGADELFGGYSWHRRAWRFERFHSLIDIPLVRRLIVHLGPLKLRNILSDTNTAYESIIRGGGRVIPDDVRRKILKNDQFIGDNSRNMLNYVGEGLLSSCLDIDIKSYLVSVLQRQDRMSMASGVESRVPFLDHEFVELVLKISVNKHFSGGKGKAILREVAKEFLPESIVNREKVGFRIPIADWMREGQEMSGVLDWLTDTQAVRRQVWNVAVVEQLVQEHRHHKADHSETLWVLLAFEMWARIWLDKVPHEQLKLQVLELSRR